ncbi:MAG TPA: insulinase family protein [Planctomycetota bacterium]|nr:insulinase family protein [Planctomycetota bacterium]
MNLRLLLVSSVMVALSAGEAPPFPHQRSELKPDPGVVWGALDNGLRYALMRNEQPRDKVSIRLQVQSGSLQETDPQRGLAHYLEHLAFNGTENYKPGEVVTMLQAMGIAFGQHSNAHTSFDETVYKLDLPDAQAATIETGLAVMADWAGGMLLLPAEVEKERGIILAEMRDRNTPDFRQRLALYAAMYPGLVLPARFPIGTQETVGGATVELIRDFYEAWYRPERMVLAVVGAFDPAAVEAQVRTRFAALTAKRPAAAEPPFGSLATGDGADAVRVLVHREAEAEGTELMLARVRAMPRPHDNVQYRRDRLLTSMAEQVLSRRLSDIAEKDPQGPLLSCSAYSYHWLDLLHAGLHGQVRPGKALAGVPVVEHELRRMIEHGPTEAELTVVKSNLRSALEQGAATAQNRPNNALAGALYSSVDDDEVFMSPAQSRDLHLPWIEAATVDELRLALAAAWADGHRLLAITGQDDLGADGEQALRQAWTDAIAAPVAAPAAQESLSWAYGIKPDAGAIANDASVTHDIRQMTFANRASASLKRTEFKPGEVLVRVRLQIAPEPRQAGVAELLGRAYMLGGLGRHSMQDLRDVLAGTSAKVEGPGVDEDGVVFGGSCLPKDLEMCLQQLRAWLTDPGWRPEAEAQAKAAWLEELRSLDTNLDARTGRRFNELAVHGAPQRRAANLAEAEAVTFADARAWLMPILARAPLTIAIVGDIDVQQAGELVAAYIGSLPEREPPRVVPDGTAEGALVAAQPLPTVSEAMEVPGSVARALIEVAWPTDDFFDVVRTRRLGMLGQILSERLRVRVREEFGHAYSPYAYHTASQAYDGFGFIAAQAGVDPGNADEARALIIGEAKRLAADGIPDEEFGRIHTPVVKNLAARRQQNQYWLESVMILSPWQPQRLAWAETMESDYAAITPGDLHELAKRYLAGDAPLQVIGICRGEIAPLPK